MLHHLFFDKLDVKRSTEFPRNNELNYNSATQVGNWYEERLRYEKTNLQHHSVYSDDYCPKTLALDEDLLWSEKTKAEGVDPIVHPKNGCWDYPNYFENFSTTYDLSFNHYPQWYRDRGHIERKRRSLKMPFEPKEDYIQTFHNITGGDLLAQKRQEWRWNPYTTQTTVNQDTFKPPDPEYYKFDRHATAAKNSLKLHPLNFNARFLKLRDDFSVYRAAGCIDTSVIRILRKPGPNPITWEVQRKHLKSYSK